MTCRQNPGDVAIVRSIRPTRTVQERAAGRQAASVSGMTQRRTRWRSAASQDAEYRAHWKAAASADVETPDALTWAVLGDSAAVGVGAARVEESYVAQVAAGVAERTGRPVRVLNLAVSGATAAHVLADQLPLLPADGVDAVTCVVGGNDVAWPVRFRVDRFAAPLEEVAQRLPAGATLGTVPVFRIPPYESRVECANAAVRVIAARHGLGVADVHAATRRTSLRHQVSMLSHDLFHPNGAGYRDWARAVLPEVLRQVRGEAPTR